MAAATSAVFGSHFGAFGTVGGAAVGSVVTTVGANLYQRSLERARDRVARQIPLPATLAARTSQGAVRPGGAPSDVRAAVPAVTRAVAPQPAVAPFPLGRLIGMSLVGVVLFFALGIGVITGIEWVKGSPLYGGTHGTSVGQALEPVVRKPTPPVEQEIPLDESAVPDTDAPESATPSVIPDPTSSSDSKKAEKKAKDKAKTEVPTPSAPLTPSNPLPLPGLGLPGG
jgi:hypothetical protein